MDIRYYIYTASIAICPILASCNSHDEPKASYPDVDIKEIPSKVIKANNDFTLNLFDLKADENQDNFVLSPLSLNMALSMVALSGDDDCCDEIKLNCGYPAESNSIDYFQNCLNLNYALRSADSDVICNLHNSLWIHNDLDFNPDYKNNAEKYFLAESFNADLHSQQSVKNINKWISDKTDGAVAEMLSKPLDADCALINTLYFKGKWHTPFNKNKTVKEQFKCKNGNVSVVDMMHATIDTRYYEKGDVKVIELPYGSGAFSMYVILDDSAAGNSCNYQDMFKNGGEFEPVEANISMPKFHFSSTGDMVSLLNDAGINKIFNQGVNGILSNSSLIINQVLHGVDITVDESGTVAASATIVGGITSAGDKIIDFNVNRPFTFIIRENRSGLLLFMGRINSL